MKPKVTKAQRLQIMKNFNSSQISQPQQKPILLNNKLTSNPFLKDQQKFHYLVYKLNQYNKKIVNGQIKDKYQKPIFQRLHSMTSDLSQIQKREDQVKSLIQVFDWFKDQQKLLQQRTDQGQVRYKTTKQTRYGIQVPQKQQTSSPKSHKDQFPTQILERHRLPYKKKWRTTHKQLQVPLVRLQQYKRKHINIIPFNQNKDQKKAPRILYPKIQKLQQPKQQQPQENIQQNQLKQGQQGQQKQGQVKQGQQQQQNQIPDNLGDFGQQPQQPEQQQIQQVKDKLAPRFKPYTKQHQDIKRKQYKQSYLFYKGEQAQIERRMQQRYIRKQHNKLNKERNDKIGIDMLHEWGVNKNKIQKQFQKKLQNMKFTPRYSYSQQDPPQIQKIDIKDQIKYGFSAQLRTKPSKNVSIDIGQFQLPKIREPYLIQKQRRKDNLKSLKNKFKNILNFSQHQQRQVSQSLCQYSSRKRGLSQILREHSTSKQRLRQLDQISSIKQKLSRNKAGIDMKSLSMAVCCPEDQQNIHYGQFPDKDLPKNPFWVQPAKKKKKKKP